MQLGIHRRPNGAVVIDTSMRVSMTFITATSAVSLLDGRAGAAKAGPHELDVLGYDPGDHKIYLLEHFNDESGDLPQLHFVHTRGGHAGRLVPVKSWYQGDAAEVEARFEERLEALRGRIAPMRPLDDDALRLRTRVLKRRALRLFPNAPPIRKYLLSLTVRPTDEDAIASIGGRAEVTAYLRPRTRLIDAYRIPGERLAVAIVAYTGVPIDVGHDKNEAILVPL